MPKKKVVFQYCATYDRDGNRIEAQPFFECTFDYDNEDHAKAFIKSIEDAHHENHVHFKPHSIYETVVSELEQ